MVQTSLIVTSYDRHESLHLVMDFVKRQIELPDEILTADDGSGLVTLE